MYCVCPYKAGCNKRFSCVIIIGFLFLVIVLLMTSCKLERHKEESFFRNINNIPVVEIKNYFSEGGNVNLVNSKGNSLLNAALLAKRFDIVTLLLNHGVDLNTWGSLGSGLVSILTKGTEEVIEKTLELKPDLNNIPGDEAKRTPLMFLLSSYSNRSRISNVSKIISRLIAQGTDVNAVDKNGTSVLSYAAENLYLDKASYALLMQSATDIDAPDKYGNTPLLFASAYGNEAFIKLLFEHSKKIDVNRQNVNGDTALNVLIKEGIKLHKEDHTPLQHIMLILLAHGANVKIENKHHRDFNYYISVYPDFKKLLKDWKKIPKRE